jgi:phage-related protein
MANNFGRVNVSISASTGGLSAGLSRAGKSLRAFASGVSSVTSPFAALGSIAKSTFGQLALFSVARGVVSSLTGMASSAADGVDQLSKLSRRLGTTYSELAGLKLAGDLAGVGIDEIAKAMTKADVALIKAQSGSKAANAAFATLGLTTEQLSGMSAADRFEAIASAISALPDEAARSAAAIALFGKAGAQLLPLFEGGASGIRQAREEAERFGLALTNAQGRNVEEMNDSFTRVYAAIQGIVQQVIAHLAPAIAGIAKQFTDFVGSVGGANIGQAIGEALLDGADFLAQVGDYIIANFGPSLSKVFQYLSQVGEQWASVVDLMSRVSSVVAGVFYAAQAMFLGSIGALTTATLRLAEIGQQIGQYLQFDTSSLDALIDTGRAFKDGVDESIVNAGKSSIDAFRSAFSDNAESIGEAVAMGAEGPLQAFVRRNREAAQAAAASVDEASNKLEQKRIDAPLIRDALAASSAELRSIVVGTSEGESFRNMLARGGDARLSGDPMKEIADSNERAADGIDDLVALAEQNGFGLAAINV